MGFFDKIFTTVKSRMMEDHKRRIENIQSAFTTMKSRIMEEHERSIEYVQSAFNEIDSHFN